MKRRRELLAGLAAATTAPLAGCSPCGETWAARQLAFDVETVTPTADGWELTVSATADFAFPKSGTDGFGTFDVALYAADRSLLDYATVDGLRWRDVPEADRTETDCGDHGSRSVTRSFSVVEVPHYVGPRFVEGHEAASLDPNSSQGFSALEALRYAPGGDGTATPAGAPTPTTGTEATAGTTGTPTDPATTPTAYRTATGTTSATPRTPRTANGSTTPTASRTAAGTTDATTPGPDGELSPDDYEVVAVEALPWPEPDNQAVTETDRLTNLRFRTSPSCTSRRGARLDLGLFEADVLVEWARLIPEGSCERPYLESASLADGRLTVRVGLHQATQVRCRDCAYVRYRLLADWREGVDRSLEEAEFVHVTGSGEVVERIVRRAED